VPTIAKNYGWNFSFFIAGLFPLITLLFSFFLLKEKSNLTGYNSIQSSNFIDDFIAILKNRKLMITCLSGFLAMWGTWGSATWANTFMHKSLDLSLIEAGFFMSFYGFSALLCKPIIGIIMDITHWNKPKTISVLLLAFGLILIMFGTNRNIIILYFITPILGILAFIYSPVMNTFAGELVSTKNIGFSMGFINAFWQLGSLISPLVVGSIIDHTHNFFYVFLTLGIGPILGSIIILLVNKTYLEA
jgi:predicted MFS family arabinose efflux permease